MRRTNLAMHVNVEAKPMPKHVHVRAHKQQQQTTYQVDRHDRRNRIVLQNKQIAVSVIVVSIV